MIEADLHGKTSVREDVLTSCCFGLINLLPPACLVEVINLAKNKDLQQLNLPLPKKVEFEYWPWINGAGEPDATATLDYPAAMNSMKIVIEVKNGSSLSDDLQLAKYYNGALMQFSNYDVALIYLTHHRTIPLQEIIQNEHKLARCGKGIYWLNWHSISEWLERRLENLQLIGLSNCTDYRIAETLYRYLKAKGYRRFSTWGALPLKRTSISYTRGYSKILCPRMKHAGYYHGYFTLKCALLSCSRFYWRTFFKENIPTNSTAFYKP